MASHQRNEILTQALKLSHRFGLDRINLHLVAIDCGIEIEEILQLFPDNSALQNAVVAHQLDSMLSDRRIRDASVGPVERLLECLSQFLPDPSDQAFQAQPISSGGLEGSDPDHFDKLGAQPMILDLMSHRAHQRIENWLRILLHQGYLKSPDTARTATLLAALVNGLSIDLSSQISSVDYPMALDLIAEVLSDMIISCETDTEN